MQISDQASLLMKRYGTMEKIIALANQFEQKANSHEDVSVTVWVDTNLYIEVKDRRKMYPENLRALVTVDATTGKLKNCGDKKQYSFVRSGWQRFVFDLIGYAPVYSG